MNKNTKITLEELLRRKDQALAAKKKPKTKELYIESLGGTITIKEPDRDIITDAQGAEDDLLSNRYLVYQCTASPNLHDGGLRAAYGCEDEPDRIVDMIISIGEQQKIAVECMNLAGFDNKVHAVKAEVKDLKNA